MHSADCCAPGWYGDSAVFLQWGKDMDDRVRWNQMQDQILQ
ncbi:MAG: hypothetical protein RBR01_04730 [Desulfobacterales bacterium]|nr:hypothetical protein [Desulfobacterales bacterium]